jgi:DNA primase
VHRERKLSALRRSLKDDGWTKGPEANFYCPRHEHHKRKLAVNVENDVFHCWVCGWGGHNLLPLLALGGKDHPDYLDYAAEMAEKVSRPKENKEYDRVRLPNEFRPLCVDWGTPYYRQAIGYLSSRGITADDILTYKLGYGEEGKYAERIIVPSFDEYGELNFFVGRALWARVGPPYLSGKFDKNIIFNELLVDWSKPISLVEGPFDAIKAGTQAIALQGKFLSEKLLSKIIEKRPKVTIALDADAVADSLKIAERLMLLGVETDIVKWEGNFKDPGDMTKEQFTGLKRVPFRGVVDMLKFRVMHSGTLGHS